MQKKYDREDVTPDYIKIFTDIIKQKFPQRIGEFEYYLEKERLNIMEVIELNRRIFGVSTRETEIFNQKHKSYDRETIMMMLDYQVKHKLNNVQLANHFDLSRNTVARWKRIYLNKKNHF